MRKQFEMEIRDSVSFTEQVHENLLIPNKKLRYSYTLTFFTREQLNDDELSTAAEYAINYIKTKYSI